MLLNILIFFCKYSIYPWIFVVIKKICELSHNRCPHEYEDECEYLSSR